MSDSQPLSETEQSDSYRVTLTIRTVVKAATMRDAVEESKGLVTRHLGLFPNQFETLRFDVEGYPS